MRNLSLWIYCIVLMDRILYRHQRRIAPYQQYHELLPVYLSGDYILRFMLKTLLILAIEVPSRIALGDLLCVLRNISTGRPKFCKFIYYCPAVPTPTRNPWAFGVGRFIGGPATWFTKYLTCFFPIDMLLLIVRRNYLFGWK